MTTLTVADLKTHLNVTSETDDTMLAAKIEAAEAWIAAYCGGEFEETPAPVLEATRQLAAHLYENREASLIGISASELPFGMLDLLNPYRGWAF